jgi:membrane fusion protein (multidrug efflux system)
MIKHPRAVLTLVVALVAASAVAVYFIKSVETASKLAAVPAKGAVRVETTQAKHQKWGTLLESVGTVQSFSGVTLRAQIGGRITEVNAVSGAQVKAGEVLFVINPEVLKAQLEQHKAQLKISQFNNERMKTLYGKRQISLQKTTEARSQYEADLATVRATEQQLDLATTYASFDGVVGLTRVEVGDEVGVNQELVTLESSERLRVEFSVPQKYALLVSPKNTVTLTAEKDSNVSVQATVYAVDPLVDPQTRTANIRAEVPPHSFFPGSYVNVSLTLNDVAEVVTVPQTAIKRSLYGDSVFQVVDGKAVLTHVELGTRRGGDIAILEGLDAGVIVVSAGLRKLSDGVAVQGSPADPKAENTTAIGGSKTGVKNAD